MTQVSGAGEGHSSPLFRLLFPTLLSPSWFPKCIPGSDMLLPLSVVFKYRSCWVWANGWRNADLVPWEKNKKSTRHWGVFSHWPAIYFPVVFLFIGINIHVCMCVCAQLYTHSTPVTWVQRWSVRHERMRLQQPAAFCLLSASHRNPFQQPMLFICPYYLVFLNIIKVIKTAPFGSFKLPQWRGLFIYFGVCLFFTPLPSFSEPVQWTL